MAIEIERKFVVKKIPNDEIKYSHYIKQGYIISDMQKVIRVRQKKDDFFILLKEIKLESLDLSLNTRYQRKMRINYLKISVKKE